MLPAKCAIFAVAAIICLIAATSAPAATDPRKCSYLTTPKACAQQAAINALKATMRARGLGGWDANLSCSSQMVKLLVWRCDWTSGTPGSAMITFRALSNGWHTRVTLAP